MYTGSSPNPNPANICINFFKDYMFYISPLAPMDAAAEVGQVGGKPLLMYRRNTGCPLIGHRAP